MNYNNFNPATTAIFIVAFVVLSIVVFVLVREFVLWYYKINVRVKNQEQIIELLEDVVRISNLREL